MTEEADVIHSKFNKLMK